MHERVTFVIGAPAVNPKTIFNARICALTGIISEIGRKFEEVLVCKVSV